MSQGNEVGQPKSTTCSEVLKLSILHLLEEAGFHGTNHECIETLTDVMQNKIKEICNSSIENAQLTNRIKPNNEDVFRAVIDLRIPLRGIEAFAERSGRRIITLPRPPAPKPLNLMPVGTTVALPSYVPDHLPPVPDVHCYIRTPAYEKQETDYAATREKVATRNRDMENLLTDFLCKTHETQSLFETKDDVFPLVVPTPSYPSYLAALNPSDQIFDFEQLEYHYSVANRTQTNTNKDDADAESGEQRSENVADMKSKQQIQILPNSTTNRAILANPNINNPYLRAPSLPKRAKQSDEGFAFSASKSLP